MPVSCNDALLTDLYQLAMLQGYFEQGMRDTAVFELFVRRLPPGRQYLIAAGLSQAIEYLQQFHFTDKDIAWLEASGRFSSAFIDYLRQLRFTGDVHAMAEGTVFFANEPILRVTAPLPEAQLVESRLINILHYQTLIASKAARIVLSAPGRMLVDFGMRRAHGGEAGLYAARASYLAGFDGTATTLAAPLFGVPVYGTMAHAFVQSHDNEISAFEHFAQAQPNNVVLLIDTYDTERAASHVVSLAPRLQQQGISIQAVRLDSGDLASHACKVRKILDEGGLERVRIFASGNLDEYRLSTLLADGAPIDGFGIGTLLATSADAPYLDCAYKLQEYAGLPRRKRSEGKETWPGRKQVYRQYNSQGVIEKDILTLADETLAGRPLIKAVMRQGRVLQVSVELENIRKYVRQELASLPLSLRRIDSNESLPPEINESLVVLAQALDAS